MHDRLVKTFITGGITKENYRKMLDDNMEEDSRNIHYLSLAFSLFWGALSIIWYFKEGLVMFSQIVILPVCYFLLCIFHKPKSGKDNIRAFIFIIITSIYYGLVTEYYNHMNGDNSFALIGTLMMIIMICPLRPIVATIAVMSGSLLYILEMIICKPPMSIFTDMINIIFYSIGISLIQSKINCLKIEAYFANKSNKEHAVTDVLTGLNNRMAYAMAVDKYEETKSELPTCIYVDVNGLHELNNRLGHAAGDKMIITVANSLSSKFGIENVFRIGGDEFVIMNHIYESETINETISQIKNELEQNKYYISVGYSIPTEKITSVNELIQIAEKDMYSDKEEYYKKNNIDRRTKRI